MAEVTALARVGEPAPDFEAIAYYQGDFQTFKLSDYRGKWVVLFFYPADFTFVCPTELTVAAKRFPEFKELNAEFWAISTDTHFTHKAWVEHELNKLVPGGIPYPMLADANGRISRLYGVYNENSGLARRGRFIIDAEGILQSMEITADPLGRSVPEILRQLKACDHFCRTGEATPAGWEPGKTTLKPGAALVGHVCDFWSPE